MITTEDDKSFSSEIIAKPTSDESSIKFENLNLNVMTNQDIKISCSNCEQPLTIEKEVSFNRILSLPSSSLAVSDWFCHIHSGQKIFQPNIQPKSQSFNTKHDTNDNHDDGIEEEVEVKEDSQCFNEDTQVFQPKINDLFYGNFHILINSKIIELNRFRHKSGELRCKRCLQLICQKNYTSRSLMFWYENIKFNGNFLYCHLSPIDLIKKVICNHISHNPSPIIKLIFEAIIPSSTNRVHILLQIMDKNMKILKLNLDNSTLTEHKSIKVIFLKLTQDNSNDDHERTLKYWQKDFSILSLEVSFNLFHILCEYLQSMCLLIPESLRFHNFFQLSYIFMND